MVDGFVRIAFLLAQFGQVEGRISQRVLDLELLGELVVLVEVLLCLFNLLHLQVALRERGVGLNQ